MREDGRRSRLSRRDFDVRPQTWPKIMQFVADNDVYTAVIE